MKCRAVLWVVIVSTASAAQTPAFFDPPALEKRRNIEATRVTYGPTSVSPAAREIVGRYVGLLLLAFAGVALARWGAEYRGYLESIVSALMVGGGWTLIGTVIVMAIPPLRRFVEGLNSYIARGARGKKPSP